MAKPLREFTRFIWWMQTKRRGGRQPSDQANRLGLWVRQKEMAATIRIHHRHLLLLNSSQSEWAACFTEKVWRDGGMQWNEDGVEWNAGARCREAIASLTVAVPSVMTHIGPIVDCNECIETRNATNQWFACIFCPFRAGQSSPAGKLYLRPLTNLTDNLPASKMNYKL